MLFQINFLYSTYYHNGKQQTLPQRKTTAEKEPRHLVGKFRQASNNEDDVNPFNSLHIRPFNDSTQPLREQAIIFR
jgi:hypothetical protein